jgi:hypothetical protein
MSPARVRIASRNVPPAIVAPRTPAVTLFAGFPPITFGLIAFGS